MWTRGVAKNLISQKPYKKTKSPKIIYVGRVSKEKNLEVLCELQDKFEITIVGEGPILERLKEKYPKINFTGYRFGRDLADIYREHDVFYPPQPYPSWTIEAPTWIWTPPIPFPIDGNKYNWDETTKTWVAL